MSAFKKAEVFILIGQIIDNTLLIQDSIHRNQIAAQLIEKYPELIAEHFGKYSERIKPFACEYGSVNSVIPSE